MSEAWDDAEPVVDLDDGDDEDLDLDLDDDVWGGSDDEDEL